MTQLHYSPSGRRGRYLRLMCLVAVVICGLLASACTGSTAAAPPTSEPDTPDEVPDPTESVESTTTVAPTTSEDVVVPEPHPLELIDADFDGALLGISTELSAAARAPRFEKLEADAGRQLDIGHVFHSWDKPIPTRDDLFHIDGDRILMISWNGTDTKEIAAGVHDEWIRTQAAAVRDLDRPVLLRWLWEMDGQRRRAWVHSGPDYVAAWKQIRSVFDEVGADNAQFVWCPNEFLFWDGGDPEPWYPGDEHVDWLCADGYNWASATTDPEWITIDKIFEDFVEWAAPRNKPIVIAETGSNEGEDGAKAEWLRSVPELLRNELPEIDAVVYFDKDFTEFGHPDWRLDTSDSAYEGWIDMANDPYFNTQQAPQ